MFVPFAKAVHDRYNQLAKNELFVTDIDLWDTYIAAFPEGTNPIYKVRAEHDCSCCRNFIRNLGNVVAIVDGVLEKKQDSALEALTPEQIAARLKELGD